MAPNLIQGWIISVFFYIISAMASTYASKSAFLLLSLAWLSIAQSLEDKVSQARKLQAQSLLGVDDQAMDAMLKERAKKNKGGNGQEESAFEAQTLDSLIS